MAEIESWDWKLCVTVCNNYGRESWFIIKLMWSLKICIKKTEFCKWFEDPSKIFRLVSKIFFQLFIWCGLIEYMYKIPLVYIN
jgi:hypothetical protein